MTHAKAMLDTYPGEFGFDAQQLADVVEALVDCASTCTQCADACLSEGDVALAGCIRLNLDCADICAATSRVMARQTDYDAGITTSLLEACVTACRRCGDECRGHAERMEHCRICADQCHVCEQACQTLLASTS
jgi:hypothetical protein